jgi:hypothetical protein
VAVKRIFEVTAGNGTVIYIEYNDVNLRVGNIAFTVPATLSGAHVLLWDDGVLAYEQTFGPGEHEVVVPGNYRVVEYQDEGETYAYPPPEISWSFSEIP